MNNYKDAWFELKSRLENFLWGLEWSDDDKKRIDDVKAIINKMNDFEKQID